MIHRDFTIAELKRFPALKKCPKTVTGEHRWYKDSSRCISIQKWWEMMPRVRWTHFRFRCCECDLLDDRKEYPYENHS